MSGRDPKDTILVVDDSVRTLDVIRRQLADARYRVYTATSVPEALKMLEATAVDLVVTDLKMPKVSGLDLIRHVRENSPDTEVMMITGYATVEGAVTAVKSGAEEYLAKPFTEKELLAAVRRTLMKLHTRRVSQARPEYGTAESHGLIGGSDGIRGVCEAIAKIATTSATVLIYGESGTGKELVARGIHYASPRASSAFVPVNCGGIPETLLESELFGHIKGAFSGASETRAGFFQTADCGTIFLDEISETSLAMQVKLLRVLEDKEVRMVGSAKTRKVNVRILAATNKDLLALIAKGEFREDLYYRLNVINIAIPPLRERSDDILVLANHFVSKYGEEVGGEPPRFTDAALDTLRNYSWPGNVRELQNLMHRLVVMASGNLIDVADLPSLMRFSANAGHGIHRTLEEMEAEHIRSVLASVGGNKSRAAEILGIARKTLRKKLGLNQSTEG
jgi:DNA-binding NtrC family response regulator